MKYVFSSDEKEIQERFGKMLMQMKPGTVVLECGCATGYLTHFLSERWKCKVYIIEYEQTAFDIARQYAAGGVCADLMQDTWLEYFSNMQFDYILFPDVLEHLSDPQKVVRAASTLLKNDGKMLVSLPNIGHNDILLKLMKGEWNYTKLGLLDDTHIHFWGINNLQPFFEEAGMHIDVLDAAYLPTMCTEQFADSDHQPDGKAIDLICSRREGEVFQFIITLVKKKRGIEMKTKDMIKEAPGRERFVHSLISKVFLDTGNGFNEEQSRTYPFEDTPKRNIKLLLKPEIKVIRFDPVELMGCVIRNLRITLEGKPISISYTNGIAWGDAYIYQDDDPQISIALPESTKKRMIHFCADVYPFKDHIIHQVFSESKQSLLNDLIQMQQDDAAANDQKISTLQQQINEAANMLEEERQQTHNLTDVITHSTHHVQQLETAYHQQSQQVFDALSREQTTMQHLIDENRGLQEQVAGLQYHSGELMTRTNTLTEKLAIAQQQAETLLAQNSELNTSLTAVQEKLQENLLRNERLSVELEHTVQNRDDLAKQREALLQKQQVLQQQIDAVNEEKRLLAIDFSEVQMQKEQLNSAVTERLQSYNALKSEFDNLAEQRGTLSQRLQVMQQQIDAVNEEKRLLAIDFSEAQKQKEQLNSAVTEKLQSYNALKSEFDNLAEQRGALSQRLQILQQQIDAVNEEKRLLAIDFSEAQKQKEQLNSAVTEKTQSYNILKTQFDDLAEQREALLLKLQELQQQIDTANEEKRLLSSDFSEAHDALDRSQANLNEANGSIKWLHNKIYELNQQMQAQTTDKETLTTQLSEVEQQLEISRQDLAAMTANYHQMKMNYELINNADFWKITKPLRSAMIIAKRIPVGKVLYKIARSLKNEGFSKTADKAKKRLFKRTVAVSTVETPVTVSETSVNSLYEGFPCDLRVEKKNVLVSIIVPNYNHAPYLRERLDSIYNQTYRNFEVILLDDCSKDGSRKILNEYAQRYPDITRVAFNEKNVGRVNLQWEKGMALANGELIWIAESDDYCELDFLEKLVPAFEKESVQIAYARSVFMKNGSPCWTLEEYLHDLPELNWRGTFYETAYNLVRKGFAVKNVIPNVSSALFRKRDKIPDRIMKIWENIRLCGDWLFYLDVLKGGVLFYTSATTNYYRVHEKSTSLDVQKTEKYYIESETISKFVAANYDVDPAIFNHTRQVLLEHYYMNNPNGTVARFDELYSLDRIRKAAASRKPNVLICGFSFSVGGGEIVPIQLANALNQLDVAVTFVNCRYTDTVEQVRNKLPRHVPVVNVNDKIQLIEIAREFGAEIIHSHHASVDQLIAEYVMPTRPNTKHIITLHGMYETISDKEVIDTLLRKVTASCDKFVYIADKNLRPFQENNCYDPSRFVKLPNGMPIIKSEAISRQELGIPQDAFVLCLVSRALFTKGWMEAVDIVNRANKLSKREIHLVMVGNGEAYDKLCKHKLSNYIHLVGVQQNTAQYYKMADMGFLPSRYAGESFPLVVIESLLCGKPVLASNLGEVRNMLSMEDNALAGAVFELKDMKIPIDEVARMVAEIAQNKKYYASMKKRAPRLASRYDILTVAQQYLNVYQSTIKQ